MAYFWQDALVALLFAAVELSLRNSRVGRTLCIALYWMLVIYAVINVPVGRAVATPLTWAMLRAARGPLADSMLTYVTWTNGALISIMMAAAAIFPRWLRPARRASTVLVAFALLAIVVGPLATARADTLGLHRTAVVALFEVPRSAAATHRNGAPWTRSPFPTSPAENLTQFRGAAKGRNVILVSLESTAAQYLSLYGSKFETMPRLTAMARDAMVFDAAYAAYPESIKGLFSVLCSVYPSLGERTEALAASPCRALPTILSDAGYRTGLFHSGRFDYLGMQDVIRNRGYQALEDAGDIGGNHNSSFGVDEPSTVARMLAWIDSAPREKPFFLTYLPIAGHHPYETPERGPFPEHDEIGRYRNALHYGDASLGALADGLRARGLDQNTIWIVFGDHGEAFGQHEGNYGHTFFLYDENVHVPFLVIAPGLIHGPLRASKSISLVEVAPSVLDLLGVSEIAEYQGRSVLDPEPRMALFFADYSLTILGLRDGPWKFIHDIDSGRTRLFHLPSDPAERTDLSSSHADRAAGYKIALRGWSGL
jgi:arylsulfatase A-like enzyme